MNRFVTIMALLLLIAGVSESAAKGQSSSKLKPTWVGKTPKSLDPEMQFVVVEDVTSSLTNISKTQYANLENYLDKEVQTSGTIRNVATKDSSNAYLDFLTTIKGGKYRPVQIDQYWERLSDGMYHHYSLYSVATLDYDGGAKILLDDRYGARGLWRSMLIPGWGQFHKGSKAKGGLMLGGCAVAAIAAVFAENQASDYYSKIAMTYDVNNIRTYSTKHDNYTSVRNLCIGAAAAIYLYNIIDAVAAPGARRVKVSKSKSYAFAPTIIDNGAMGLMASVKF